MKGPLTILLLFDPIAFAIVQICSISFTIWLFRNRSRRPKLLAIVATLYLGSYILLSANGQYMLANHGGSHWTLSWYPRFVIVQYSIIRSHIRPTSLAALYTPLLMIDRSFVHPKIDPSVGNYGGKIEADWASHHLRYQVVAFGKAVGCF